MALTITGTNPIVVTGTTAASVPIKSTGNQRIYKNCLLYWLNPTTAGHKLALQDGDGNEKFEFYCAVANVSLVFPPVRIVLEFKNGIYCDDMDSGTLYIYHDGGL